MSEGSSSINAVRVPVECIDVTITVHHNALTNDFEVEGLPRNLLLARAILEQVVEMVKRELLKAEMQHAMQNGPRILRPGIPPQ